MSVPLPVGTFISTPFSVVYVLYSVWDSFLKKFPLSLYRLSHTVSNLLCLSCINALSFCFQMMDYNLHQSTSLLYFPDHLKPDGFPENRILLPLTIHHLLSAISGFPKACYGGVSICSCKGSTAPRKRSQN